MYAIKSSVLVGYSAGQLTIVPDDDAFQLPYMRLTLESTIIACTLLSCDVNLEAARKIIGDVSEADLRCRQSQLLSELRPYIVDGICDQRVTYEKVLHSLKVRNERISLNNDLDYDQKNHSFKLDYPVKVTVVPTWKCNRSCAYCGIPKLLPHLHEERIDSRILLDRLLESASLGVQCIEYHGGEPLLYYAELLSQIKTLRMRGMRVKLSTKSLVTEEMAVELMNAGIDNIQLSIDTVDKKISKLLYNDELYYEKVKSSIKALRGVGINVKINIVLTRLNVFDLISLLDYLDKCCIEDVAISNLRVSSCVNSEIELLSSDWHAVNSQINENRAKWSFSKLAYSPNPVVPPPSQYRPYCESGRFGLLFLPDGTGCYCDHLHSMPKFRLGNLVQDSVSKIWESKYLNNLAFPTKEFFKNTKCFSCNAFDLCSMRGICYMKTGGDYKPDDLCEECFDGGVGCC